MKKALYLILVAVILLSCVACGGEVASSEISEITPPISSEEVKDDISSDVDTSSEPISSTEPSPKPSTSTSTPVSSKQETSSRDVTSNKVSLPRKDPSKYTDIEKKIKDKYGLIILEKSYDEYTVEDFKKFPIAEIALYIIPKEEYATKTFSPEDFPSVQIREIRKIEYSEPIYTFFINNTSTDLADGKAFDRLLHACRVLSKSEYIEYVSLTGSAKPT